MKMDQCNICGSFDVPQPCPHCATSLCGRCQHRHGAVCEDVQKRIKRGEGKTIKDPQPFVHRAGHETPPTTGPDRHNRMNPVLGAPYNLSPDAIEQSLVNQAQVDIYASTKLTGLHKYAEETSPVDQGLAGVKELLRENSEG